ncbi:MAG TPA: universal stress protein [Burkholderiaceae bacterium]
MNKILVPVDGSEYATRALKFAIQLAIENPSIELFILNVQLPIQSGLVHQFISNELIEKYHASEGGIILEPARELAKASGAKVTSTIAVGPIGETVADYVIREKCDHIVMGTRGMGGLVNLVIGSVASKVIHIVDVPVTVVK